MASAAKAPGSSSIVVPSDGFEGDFPLAPSLVVETSPGHFRRYWLVDGDWPADEQTDFAGVMACLCAQYGSDTGAKDISRVLRMPGFLHRNNPDEPHMVRVVGGNRRRYTRAQIARHRAAAATLALAAPATARPMPGSCARCSPEKTFTVR